MSLTTKPSYQSYKIPGGKKSIPFFLTCLLLMFFANNSFGSNTLAPEEIVAMTIKNNTALKVEGYSVKISKTDIKKNHGVFDTRLGATLQTNKNITPEASIFNTSRKGELQKVDFSVGKKFKSGSSAELKFSTTRSTTSSTTALLNPQLASDISLNFKKPLLKEFGKDINKKDIAISTNNSSISEQSFKNTIINTVSTALDTYWKLVFVKADLIVKKDSLNLAKEFAKEVDTRVRLGQLIAIDKLEADAEVASRQESVIIANNNVLDTEDELKRLIGLWQGKPEPTPGELQTTLNENVIDKNKQIELAFQKRPDYLSAKIELKNKKILIKYFKNQKLPSIDLSGSLKLNGLAGNSASSTSSFNGNYFDTLQTMGKGKFYSWNASILFNMPIQNSTAKANLSSANLEVEKMLYKIKNIEEQIRLEIETSVRKVQSNIQRIKATRLARKLAEQKLAVAQKRYSVGASTGFKLLEFQRDLIQEKSKEVQALTDYKRSLVALDKSTGTTIDQHQILIGTSSNPDNS